LPPGNEKPQKSKNSPKNQKIPLAAGLNTQAKTQKNPQLHTCSLAYQSFSEGVAFWRHMRAQPFMAS
jgi:hypothetical protein